jgi:hypothetical protein
MDETLPESHILNQNSQVFRIRKHFEFYAHRKISFAKCIMINCRTPRKRNKNVYISGRKRQLHYKGTTIRTQASFSITK